MRWLTLSKAISIDGLYLNEMIIPDISWIIRNVRSNEPGFHRYEMDVGVGRNVMFFIEQNKVKNVCFGSKDLILIEFLIF